VLVGHTYLSKLASTDCFVTSTQLLLLLLAVLQVTCSRGSPKRQQLLEKRGHFQVPYLEDPNTGEPDAAVWSYCLLSLMYVLRAGQFACLPHPVPVVGPPKQACVCCVYVVRGLAQVP
jgi:hypothetical protein